MKTSVANLSGDTANQISQLHRLFRYFGYEHKSYRQSAMECHVYTKQMPSGVWRRFEYNGWHGTGKGIRWFGDLKCILTFYDTQAKGLDPITSKELESLIVNSHHDRSWMLLSEEIIDAHVQQWRTVFKYLEGELK